MIAAALACLSACATSPHADASSPTPQPLWAKVDPPPGFQFGDSLLCHTVLATHPGFVSRTFSVKHALGDTAVIMYRTPTSMRRAQDTEDRVVFQAAGVDPGSLDSLSIDKRTGAFARVWSGWSLTTPELNAGAQRGYCTNGE